MKKALSIACAIISPALISQSANAAFDFLKSDGDHKRFSVSTGWLHANPNGDATPVVNKTAVKDGSVSQVSPGIDANIYGLQEWSSPGTGLESDNVDTLGLLFNYYVNDNWSVEMKAGIPPKVDILGQGEVFANVNAKAGPINKNEEIQITDMSQGNGVASTARAWLPAALVQYQFGKRGVNKLRPYVGAGLMYAYFNDIKLNSGIVNDLAVAGGRIQLIEKNKPLDALGSKDDIIGNEHADVSSMRVKAKADSAFAPIINVGATYDFNDDWYAVGSVSYAKLDSDTTIKVKNGSGKELIEAKANIDIDPYITYLGVGYRF